MNRHSGITPLDLMKKAKAEYDCPVCDETLFVWCDTTDNVGAQIADALSVHLFEEHVDGVPIEYDTGVGVAHDLAQLRDVLQESGTVRYNGEDFVVEPRETDG